MESALLLDRAILPALISVWTQTGDWGSAKVVSKFADKDGELWAGVGHEGVKALDASKDTVVARVQLKLSGSGPIKVGFRPHHNLCLGTDGKSIKASWLGGTFERK